MPKISGAGLSSWGLRLANGFTHRTNVISVTSTPVTLTAAQAGATVYLNNGTTETIVNLPAGADGLWYKFVVGSNNTNGYIIQRGTDGQLIVGGFLVVSTTDDKTAYVSSTATNDAFLLGTEASADVAGAIGSTMEVFWNGTSWVVHGVLVSAHADPASVDIWGNM